MSENERIIMSELSEQQRMLLQNAAQRVMQAKAAWEREDNVYKELLGMAMPRGANGFDPRSGVFYYEEPPVPPQTAPALVEDEVTDAEVAERLDPETDYEGSPENARLEGREVPLDEDDES